MTAPEARAAQVKLEMLIDSLGIERRPPVAAAGAPRAPNPSADAAALRQVAVDEIVNRQIELPLGIRFEARTTLVPLIWCAAVMGLFLYLAAARTRCHRLVARALRRRHAAGRTMPDDDEGLLHPLQWWSVPLPGRDGEVVTAPQFRAGAHWAIGGRLETWGRVAVGMASAAVFSLVCSCRGRARC